MGVVARQLNVQVAELQQVPVLELAPAMMLDQELVLLQRNAVEPGIERP